MCDVVVGGGGGGSAISAAAASGGDDQKNAKKNTTERGTRPFIFQVCSQGACARRFFPKISRQKATENSRERERKPAAAALGSHEAALRR